MLRRKHEKEGRRDRGTGGLFRMKRSKNYYAQIYRDGRPCRISTGTAVKQEARAFLNNLIKDADTGKPFIGDTSKVTYGDMRAGLIQNYHERGNKSLLVHADGEEFINGLEALDGFFEWSADQPGVGFQKINTDRARDFATTRLAEGVTNATVNNSLKLLRRMLRIAYEDGKIPFTPKIRMYRPNPARKGFLSGEKFNELIGHLPVHLRPLITFLYWTGCRLGESLEIDWDQVNLAEAIIRLEADQTKGNEARTIPLPDVLVKMLARQKVKTGKIFDGTNLRKAWCKACAASGLGTLEPVDEQGNRKYNGLIVHDLRRSAIRNLMKSGVNERVAMSISGHKTRSVFDRYNIIDETDVVQAMRRVQQAGQKSLNNFSETSVRLKSVRKRLKR